MIQKVYQMENYHKKIVNYTIETHKTNQHLTTDTPTTHQSEWHRVHQQQSQIIHC